MNLTVDQIDWTAVKRDWGQRFKAEDVERHLIQPTQALTPPTCVIDGDKLKPRLSKFLPESHSNPFPKQVEFLKLANQDVFFGGGAGGGKSIALLIAAAQFLDVPGYTAIILRRTYSELSLPGALMDVANSWWPLYRRKDGKEYWFPTGSAESRLVFGFIETTKDLDRYQSAEFHYIAFDEVTEFKNESDFQFMWSRLRNPPPGVPLRMRCASNPNGPGRLWVKKRYVDAKTREDRVFVPSLAEDNVYLREREQYERNLATQLGPVRAAQLLKGDWEIQATGMFMRQWFKIIDVAPSQMRFCRYWDLAGTESNGDSDPDYTVGALVGQHGKDFVVIDVQRVRLTSKGVEDLILQTARLDRDRYGHVVIRMEQEPGASGIRVIDDYTRLLAGYDFKGDRVTGPKEIRPSALAAQAERGNVCMLSGRWNHDALDELEVFPGGGHDDIVDAITGSFNYLTGVPAINTRSIIMVGERLRPDW